MANSFYAVVQWTSAKVTSLGIISEDEVSTGKFEVGAKIEALHRNIVYPAKILFIGDLDLMTTKLESLRNTYKASSSDSPRGRGHRVIKKRVLEDFVEDSITLKAASSNSASSKGSVEKRTSKEQNQLKRKAAELTGDVIIQKLLGQEDTGCDEDSEDEDNLEDEVTTNCFEEAQLIASLRSQLNSERRVVKQLQEENEQLKQQNYLLQKILPDLVEEVKSALISSRTSSRSPFRVIQVANSPLRTPNKGQPSSPVQALTKPLRETANSLQDGLSTAELQSEFVISNDIIRQASNAKTWGSLACNLMTALFSREEMANSCLTEKQAAKTGKIALPAEKVQAITDQVKKMFPSTETGAIRIKLSTKLRDERNAFNQG